VLQSSLVKGLDFVLMVSNKKLGMHNSLLGPMPTNGTFAKRDLCGVEKIPKKYT